MKFPKRILVKIEKPGTTDEFLGAERDGVDGIQKMVAVGEECTIGVYSLVETKRIKALVVVTQKGSVK